jgi:general secretion pathway protein B
MSYILDALKKAEAERNSDTGTNLHAQQPAWDISPAGKPASRIGNTMALGLTAMAGALVALTALVWFRPWESAPAAPVAPIAAIAPTPPAAVASAASVPPPEPAAKPAQPTPPPVAAQESASAPTPAPVKPVKPKAKPTKAAKDVAEKKPAKPDASENETRIAGLRELPAHIQNEIPPLTVSGYIYSANKADRTVLINKKLLREGDRVAPDLVLEKLTPTGMVLNYKGYRYRAGY